MKKLMLLLSFVCLGLLIVGTTLRLDNVLFWLASDSVPYQYVRILLAFVVLALLATNPPRHALFRLSTSVVAATVGVWTVNSTVAYTMSISDTVCFLATSIAISVAVLEREAATHSIGKNSLGVADSGLNSWRKHNTKGAASAKLAPHAKFGVHNFS